jgi:glycine/D-amino acid oxidase-like deaminating enzyme
MVNCDVIVVGGGLVGSAVAYGLSRRDLSVVVLDEGDVAYRASRGNFGLVWVQSKGFGAPEYQRWTRISSDGWHDFAAQLESETGIDSGHERPGGVTICLNEDEFSARGELMEQLRLESGDTPFEYRMLQREALRELLPAIGPEVVGASYTAYDGHANPLYLLRALHAGLSKNRGRYVANAHVTGIKPSRGIFTITAGGQSYSTPKLVLASGLGNKELGLHVGLNVPVKPVRGQIIVTERLQPVLDLPTLMIRQTVEGTIMIGESREEAGFDDATSPAIIKQLAERAVKTFPFLKNVRAVRTWAALRVMSPDGFPIYEQSRDYPGAFVCTCHSGVTLAAVHATHYAAYVAEGRLPADLRRFSSNRFDVQAAA